MPTIQLSKTTKKRLKKYKKEEEIKTYDGAVRILLSKELVRKGKEAYKEGRYRNLEEVKNEIK